MSQTIAAISTAVAPGGIGIVRLSGDEARRVADRVFAAANRQIVAQAAGYTALYGHVKDGDRVVDEAVALVFAAPKSYTGEDVVELSCHGGPAVLRAVLRLVLQNGARMAEAGEFTRRAFLNGKMDLTRAEAVMDIIGARGEQAARAAVAAHEGALAKRLSAVKENLLNAAAWLGAWADFPEEDIPEVDAAALLPRLQAAGDEIDRLINGFDRGRMVRRGVETVIAGSPNVGKSTLMNRLCGFESSIVTQIPGTTRDVVSEEIQLGDVCLRLSDTAGIHETADAVERIGVQRAKDRLAAAELIFAVIDASRPLAEEDRQLLAACHGRKAVAILNKSDLPARVTPDAITPYVPRVVVASAKEQTGLDDLTAHVTDLLALTDFDPAAGMLANERQLACAKRVQAALAECRRALTDGLTLDAVSVSLDGALAALMELTGERVTDAVADGVFHQFCVGK